MSEARLNMSPLDINLLQIEEPSVRSGPDGRWMLLLAVFVAGIVTTGWLWFHAASQRDDLKADIAAMDVQIANLKAKMSFGTMSAVPLSMWLEAPEALKQSQPVPTAMLDELKRLLPKQANVANLVYDSNGHLQMTGRFATLEDVMTFVRTLQQSSSFDFVKFTSLNNTAGKKDAAAPEGARQPANGASKLKMTEAAFELTYRPLPLAGKGGGR